MPRSLATSHRLATQLVALVVLVAFLSGGVVGLVAIDRARQTLREQILSSSLAAADLAAIIAADYVTGAQTDLRELNASPDFEKAAKHQDWAELTDVLERWLPEHPTSEGVTFADASGVIRANGLADKSALGTPVEHDWFRGAAAMGKPFMGQASLSRLTGKPRIPYALPSVDAQGNLLGVLSSSISLDGLSRTLTAVHVGPNARTSMADLDQGVILAHVERSRLLQPSSGRNEATTRMQTRERAAIETPNSTGQMTLSAFTAVPGLPWGIMVQQPSEDAFRPLDHLVAQVVWLIVAAVVAAAASGTAIALGIVRPVRHLRRVVEQMTHGELHARVGRTSGDELGELGRGFDRMADQLQQTLTDIQEDEARFRGLISAAFDGFVIHDDGRILEASGAFATLFGYQATELVGRAVTDVLVLDQNEMVGVRKDQSRFPVELVETECRFEGRSARSIAVRDVTARKEAEAERDRLAAIVDASREAIIRTDAHAIVTDWNGGAERLYGYSAQEMVGRSITTLTPPECIGNTATVMDALRRGEHVLDHETVRLRKDGSRINISISISPISFDARGRPLGVASVSHDISERKRAEAALLESETRYRRLVELSPQSIVVLDGERVLYANPAAARMAGADRAADLVAAPLWELVHSDDRDKMEGWLQAITLDADRHEAVEARIARRDGRLLDVEIAAISTTFQGRPAFQAILSDISARKTADKQAQALARAEKLRALGQMASGIAHDLNQSLMLIASYGDLARQALDNDTPDLDELRELVTTSSQAALDGGEAVKRLLLFTRQAAETEGKPVHLAELVREVAHMTAPRWRDTPQVEGRPISLSVEAADRPIILGSAPRLREALTNLVFNAVDALPNGGSIRLAVGVDLGRAFVAVTDTGVGMSREVQARIFEPFYTTKGGSGTGLGLAMVFAIVEQHGGHMSVDSRIGAGTTMRMDFPLAEAPARVHAAPPPKLNPVRGLRVLAVDDEPAMTKAIVRMLRPGGHLVREAVSGEEALDMMVEETFDVVVSDMGMGAGMNGWEFAAAVKQRWPEVRFMLSTGWGAAIDPAEAHRKGIEVVLSKPYRPADLEQALAGQSELAA